MLVIFSNVVRTEEVEVDAVVKVKTVVSLILGLILKTVVGSVKEMLLVDGSRRTVVCSRGQLTDVVGSSLEVSL